MKLVVAEKPSVAALIAKVLNAKERNDGFYKGDGYIVTWCLGHLVAFANPESYDEKYKKWNRADLPIIPSKWKFVVNSATSDQYKTVKALMNSDEVESIVCATDAGREGECIFRYVYNLAKCKKPVERLWVSAMQESDIADGFNNLLPDSKYDNLYAAGISRAMADWIVGMNITRLFSCMYGSLLSVGRVQTATLNLIADRYSQSINFVSTKSYDIQIPFDKFTASSEEKFKDKSDADELLKTLLAGSKKLVITDYKQEEKKTNPPALYNLTALQRDANKLYGYTAQNTLDIAQKLYEAGYITYPRTDSNYITDTMADSVSELFYDVKESEFLSDKNIIFEPDIGKIINNDKVSDHTALLPTGKKGIERDTNVSEGELIVYQMICNRLVISVAPPYKYKTLKIKMKCDGHDFTATMKEVIDAGFRGIMPVQDDEEGIKLLTDDELKQSFMFDKGEVMEHETKPPTPYTEATLLAAMETAGNSSYEKGMEKKGIGTSATRAAIIETLVNRQYVQRSKKGKSNVLIPTDKGNNLIKIAPDELKDAVTTAEWENKLQNIEQGKEGTDQFIQDIINFTSQIVAQYRNEVPTDNPFQIREVLDVKCPVCGAEIAVSKNNYFCSNNECLFRIYKTIAGKTLNEKEVSDLISKGKTDVISGFKAKSGKTFSAALRLNILSEPDEYENICNISFEFSNKGKRKRK